MLFLHPVVVLMGDRVDKSFSLVSFPSGTYIAHGDRERGKYVSCYSVLAGDNESCEDCFSKERD